MADGDEDRNVYSLLLLLLRAVFKRGYLRKWTDSVAFRNFNGLFNEWDVDQMTPFAILGRFVTLMPNVQDVQALDPEPPVPEPPVPGARKKMKNHRKRLCHSNDAKWLKTRRNSKRKKHDACIRRSSSKHFKRIKRGKHDVNNTYNITANDSAQVAIGDDARIVNKNLDYFLLLRLRVQSEMLECSRKRHSIVEDYGAIRRNHVETFMPDVQAILRTQDSRSMYSSWSDRPQVRPHLIPLPAIRFCPEFSIRDLWRLLIILSHTGVLTYDRGPPVSRARKKLKNHGKRLCHSNDAKWLKIRRNSKRKKHDACIRGALSENFNRIERGNQGVNNTYNITANDPAQMATGDNARIVNNYYTCDRQDEKTVCPTQGKVLLIKYVKDYYRRGLRAILLPLPWMEGDQYHIENIYTTTKIVEMNTKHVTPLQGIFSKAATDLNTIRRILIEGEPGIGKTAICKKIAYDWSMNKLFPAFEVVLSLKCRDFHNASDLWDAIEKQTFSDGLKEMRNHDTFNEYIENNQSKVLLVLDGYDEIHDKCADTMKQSIERLIRGQLLPDCSVIVTSRPGKGSGMRNHFDRKLEIKGFELNDSFEFIRCFFASSPEDACSLISVIENCEALKDLVRSPLNTAILCLVYEDKKHDDYLMLETLCKEIVFSLIKRYYTEKLMDKEIMDDDLMAEFHDLIYFHGKQAFNVIKENHCGIDEKEFAVVGGGAASAQFMGFLVKRKSLNKIRQANFYHFPHDSIKEYFAVTYIEVSIKSLNGREIYNIISFKGLGSFLRTLKLLYTLFKFKTCIVARKIAWSKVLLELSIRRFIYWLLYSIYTVIKIIISCFVRSVMAMQQCMIALSPL